MNLPAASVRRLHLRTATPGRTGPRLRRTLDALDLAAPGLPPSAILVVRRLEAPPWREGGAEGAWSAGLRGSLEAVARRAARPMRGGQSEEAVWFADMAELLACLALDAALGRAPWWWEGLERPLRPATLARAWLEQVEHMPRAVEHLEREGLISAALGSLAPAEATALVGALRARYGLPAEAVQGQQSSLNIQSYPLINDAVTDVTANISSGEQPAPWSIWAPSTDGLPPAVALLVGTALGLIRAPAELRSPRFIRALGRWMVAPRGPLAEAAPPGEAPLDGDAGERRTAEEAGLEPVVSAADLRLEAPGAEPAGAPPRTGRATARTERVEAPPPAQSAGLPPVSAAAAAGQVRAAAVAPVATYTHVTDVTAGLFLHREPGARPSPRAEPARPDRPPVWTLGPGGAATPPELPALALPIATRLGGAFYLVNVGILLGLYGDFTRPAEPGIDLPIFDWVARVARGLWPEAPAEDPLWDLLARLAWGSERPEDQVLPPLPDWRVRPSWPPSADETPDASLEAWLARLLPALGERLARAMPELPPARWLAQPGLVLLSSARVEVVFSLETHPIDLRIAGLDRDPGWVPAAGHTLLFRYET